MNIWHDIDSSRITNSHFDAVVEIPRGSRLKYELDKETGFLRLDRILHTSTHYPANYGFIPKTLAEDGDPLDVLILSDEVFSPMSLVTCYPIGVIKMIDENENDEKIIAIANSDPYYNEYKSIRDLPQHIFNEISHFFSVYKQLEGKQNTVEKPEDVAKARSIIDNAITRYNQTFNKKGEL